jgi:DNA-binding NarL/FixJ family response regulator
MPGELGPTRLRAVIIDDHAISRAACRALLRTEGVDVIADVAANEGAVEMIAQLDPDLVVVDVSPHDERGMAIARRIEAMAHGPRVVLTSSADLARFESRLDGYEFVAKADICSDALTNQASPVQPSFLPVLGTRRMIRADERGSGSH